MKNIFYFPSLNGLRFFAASLVVLHHAEAIKAKNQWPSLQNEAFFHKGGPAVIFFFVLSGFLITYLLLKESHQTGSISIKSFYMKRVLRIWPLYFLLVFIGAIFLPWANHHFELNLPVKYSFSDTWLYFLFFLPGLVTFYFGHHLLEPLWSIGVEEVFYLLWAPLFYVFRKSLPVLVLSLIVIRWLCLGCTGPITTELVNLHKIDAMAIGALGAWAVFHQKIPYEYGKHLFQVILLALLVLVLFTDIFEGSHLFYLLTCLIFILVIINFSVNPSRWFQMENRSLKFLGEISYGIYMYHVLVINLAVILVKKLEFNPNNLYFSIWFGWLVFALTIGIASVSRYTFESYFLKLKKS